jgi:phosphoglycolate phosphatase-like HAD superfamily hydrolase
VLKQTLQPDARATLDRVEQHGATQSVLSMAPHEEVVRLLEHHELHHRFVRVDGSRGGSSDGTKADSLDRHLDAIGAARATTVMIGDTADDAEAASACGIRVILVTTGSQSPPDLVATGAPVVDSLSQAVARALDGAEPV